MTKIKKEEVGGHKQISFRSFKIYSVDRYEKTLGKVIFPNYEKYHNIYKAYNNFFQKLIEVVNIIVPLKTARIKNTINEWFDMEIIEKLSIRDKLFKKLKSTVSTQIGKSTKRQEMTSKEQSNRRKDRILRRNCLKIQLHQKNFGKL